MNTAHATDLGRFFAPKSVALVGASEDMTRFAGRCLVRMQDFGYGGQIFPVNPSYQELRGMPCYPSVRDLPAVPDHVGIAVPANRVLGVLDDCAARGARFATVFSGGFAESATDEGRELQRMLLETVRRHGMRVMGPNCNGLVNFVDRFAMTSSGAVTGPRRAAGDIGVISQSGGLGQVNVMWRALEAGLGVSYSVSCGNSADLDAFDFVKFLVDDESTRVIVMIMEHFGDGARFVRAARLAAEHEKPIVMLKLGRTSEGARAAASHTGAMTGDDRIYDAAFRQYGVIRVDDCNELYETAMLLRQRRWPRGNRAAAATISGGNGALIVDLGASLGIDWPEYDEATKSRLRACLPRHGTTANPTDVTNVAIGRKGIYSQCLEAIAADPSVDVVVPMLTLAAASDAIEVGAFAKAATKPVAVLWTGGCVNDPQMSEKNLIADGVAVYRNTLGCLKAVKRAMCYGDFLARNKSPEHRDAKRPEGIDPGRARQVIAASGGVLTERASKQILAAYGFPLAVEALAGSTDEAVRIWRQIGTSVALKIESPDIPHKSESGAIRLNVNTEAGVRAAYDEVLAAARRHAPGAQLNGVLVQPMAPKGLELILGAVVDRVFGPVVVVGLGGIYTEVLGDIACRVAPVGVSEVRAMLSELRVAKVLHGVRGAASRDIDALCVLIERLSWLIHDLRDVIVEIDINPLILLEKNNGAKVVDALVVTSVGAAAAAPPDLKIA